MKLAQAKKINCIKTTTTNPMFFLYKDLNKKRFIKIFFEYFNKDIFMLK